jgi:dsDNA-specific endonuclease/ATPase MutS2
VGAVDSPDGTRAEPDPSGEEAEPLVLPIEDALDLHAFAPRDVAGVVDEYLHQAAARGLGEVRLIHGRGKGVQRAVVRAVLGEHPRVARFYDAPPSRGGWGSTVVVLRE